MIEDLFNWGTLIGHLIFLAVMLFMLVGLAVACIMTIFRR
jgi:hypothetical protein